MCCVANVHVFMLICNEIWHIYSLKYLLSNIDKSQRVYDFNSANPLIWKFQWSFKILPFSKSEAKVITKSIHCPLTVDENGSSPREKWKFQFRNKHRLGHTNLFAILKLWKLFLTHGLYKNIRGGQIWAAGRRVLWSN